MKTTVEIKGIVEFVQESLNCAVHATNIHRIDIEKPPGHS